MAEASGGNTTIPIPLRLPADEATALAQFVKRVDYETVNRFASPSAIYGAGRAECDVMWCSVNMLRDGLAEAGFAPR
jgi:hypothetical protein